MAEYVQNTSKDQVVDRIDAPPSYSNAGLAHTRALAGGCTPDR